MHAEPLRHVRVAVPQGYGASPERASPQSPDELFETLSQALLSAVDRDALSGWGAVVTIVTPEGAVTRTLKGRMD